LEEVDACLGSVAALVRVEAVPLPSGEGLSEIEGKLADTFSMS
jgi:hypothetical protein